MTKLFDNSYKVSDKVPVDELTAAQYEVIVCSLLFHVDKLNQSLRHSR